mgnify:CR=1 FL=1
MTDDEEMLKIAQSLRREFDELGEVTDVTKKRLKEILEDKNKREKFAEVLTKEEEEVTEMSEIDELGNITDVPKEEQIEDLLTDFLGVVSIMQKGAILALEKCDECSLVLLGKFD